MAILPAFLAAVWGWVPLRAAGHPEVTVIPLGASGVEKGAMERTFRLPQGPDGAWPQAIVFVTSRPWMDVRRPAPLAPTSNPDDEVERKQVPATIQFTVAGKALPAWPLEPGPTGYVMNLATIRTNPQFAKGLLQFTLDLQTDAPGLALHAAGSPDPLLVSDCLDGPLSAFQEAAKDADVKAYMSALILEIAEKRTQARAIYQKLTSSANAAVARFARRGMRLASYDARPHRLSGNFNEHYRWALYLQQCGLMAPAFAEFNECRIAYPDMADTHAWTAEAADRLGSPGSTICNHLVRAATLSGVSDPSDWYALVAILQNRAGMKLSDTDMIEIKNHFLLMQGMVWGATRGAVRILPTFFTVPDEADWPYHFRGDGVLGPCDDIIARRGWFDSVFSIIPQATDAASPGPVQVATVGGDEGPNGAAMSCLPQDAKWIDFLHAFYEQYAWAARVGEVGVCFPDLDRARYCGQMPVAHKGYAYRNALADGFTESMRRRPKIVDEPQPGTHVRMWTIDGPFPVQDAAPSNGRPSHHVLTALPSQGTKSVKLASKTDFIDLARLFPRAGWALARATSWVFSPDDQEVRMWLGQNDGLAVWVNGRLIHEGHYYSAGNYEDRNLVDTIASYALLKRGWNELRVVVESWPAPRDKGWGFSVRFSTWNNKPIDGLAYVYDAPSGDRVPPWTPHKPGGDYVWDEVKRDYLDALPHLSASDLAAYTGIAGLSVASEIQGLDGYIAVLAPDRPDSRTYRSIRSTWQSGRDRDIALNNVLDWARESVAALRFQKDGRAQDLLLIKPESADSFLTLLIEPPAAKEVFKGRTPKERIVGYILAPSTLSRAPVIVAHGWLGDEKTWPTDEEDLMNPLAPVYIPNKGIKLPPHLQNQTKQKQ